MSQTPPPITAETADRFCHHCGYNLRGITSTTCPECGLSIGPANVFVIPWENRKKFGRFSTFIRTAALATFRSKRFATAIGAPIDDCAARRFRLIVVLLAALPIIGIFVATVIDTGSTAFLLALDPGFPFRTFDPQSAINWQIPVVFWAGATLPPVLPIGFLIAVFLGIVAPGLWFRSSHRDEVQQSRVRAIGRYACAPWAFMPVPAGLLAIVVQSACARFPRGKGLVDTDIALLCVCAMCLLFIFAAAWWTHVRMIARTTHSSLGYVIGAGIAYPLVWVLALLVGLGLFLSVAGFVWIIIDSLRG